MNTIDNSVVNKESVMSIALFIFAILAIITAVWKGSTMNKFVVNKESVMLVVSKRSIGLAYSIVCTAVLFIPFLLLASLQDAFTLILALGPLAFTAVDILIHVEYHDEVRSLAVSYTALKNLASHQTKVRANYVEAIVKFMVLPLILFLSACNFSNPDQAFNAAQYTVESAAKEARRAARNANFDLEMRKLTNDKETLLSMMIADAVKDYENVAAMVEKFNEDNKPKAYGKVDVEIFYSEIEDFVSGSCSAWKWKNKIYSIQHCNEHRERETGVDRAEVLKKSDANFEADFYTQGTECSPDLRWWGATTNKWTYIPAEQVYMHNRLGGFQLEERVSNLEMWNKAYMALDSYNNAPNTSNQEKAKKAFKTYFKWLEYVQRNYYVQSFLCSASTFSDSVKKGDSGGPLMAGDEVIGSVSFFATTHNKWFDQNYPNAYSNYVNSCFALLDTKLEKPEDVSKLEIQFKELEDKYMDTFGINKVIDWKYE